MCAMHNMRGKIHEAAHAASPKDKRQRLSLPTKRQETARAVSPKDKRRLVPSRQKDKRGGRWSGGYSGVATPDPIPNSVVKGSCADGTAS